MKKLSKSYKAYLLRCARRRYKERKRYEDFRTGRNRQQVGLDNFQRRLLILMKESYDYIWIKAPKIFSMTENPHETISFISELENCFRERHKVFVNLAGVEVVADGAILVLLSWVIRFKDNNIDFNGNFPKKENAKNKLFNSGFFKELYKRKPQKGGEKSVYSVAESSIHTHAAKVVDPRQTAGLITDVSQKIWGSPQRCPDVQRVFIELMHNTNNHSYIGKKGEHHWWTSVSYNPDQNKASFAFIDYGVGIIKSMENDHNSRFYKIWEKLKDIFKPKYQYEILKKLLDGDLHSSTGQYYRGKGLPGVMTAFKENKLDRLFVISNKAMADVSNDSYTELDNNFTGTFVYWELTAENEHFDLK